MRYTPFEPFDRLFDRMYGAFDRPDADGWHGSGMDRTHRAHADLTERDVEFVFTADLPGFEKDEIDLRIDDGYLLLSASHEASEGGSSRRRSMHERISIPAHVDEDGVAASYHNGVLEVHLPIVGMDGEDSHRIDID